MAKEQPGTRRWGYAGGKTGRERENLSKLIEAMKEKANA